MMIINQSRFDCFPRLGVYKKSGLPGYLAVHWAHQLHHWKHQSRLLCSVMELTKMPPLLCKKDEEKLNPTQTKATPGYAARVYLPMHGSI